LLFDLLGKDPFLKCQHLVPEDPSYEEGQRQWHLPGLRFVLLVGIVEDWLEEIINSSSVIFYLSINEFKPPWSVPQIITDDE